MGEGVRAEKLIGVCYVQVETYTPFTTLATRLTGEPKPGRQSVQSQMAEVSFQNVSSVNDSGGKGT
jgi:hypothetical protein